MDITEPQPYFFSSPLLSADEFKLHYFVVADSLVSITASQITDHRKEIISDLKINANTNAFLMEKR